MRYQPIDNTLFIGNRERLTSKMLPGSMAIFHSNDILPSNADGVRPFIQDSNLFWLSGIDQEEAILVLFPDHPEPNLREVLFTRKTNEHITTWEGHKYTKEEARKTSGVSTIYWLESFKPILIKLMSQAEVVYIPTENHVKQSIEHFDANIRFVHWCRERFPLHQYHDAARIIQPLRLIKSKEEIALIQRACDITNEGFRRVLSFVRPGVWEFEIEAEYAHEFLRRRARGFAYQPIIGSGARSCVLHYVENNAQCRDGDVLLMDVGACYANYAADMTRTIPINGRFTQRQKAVYQAVHRTLQQATKLMQPGTTPEDYNTAVEQIVEKELVDMGLISMHDIQTQDPDRPAFQKYFMHKTAHSLGLDVHDVGDRSLPFAPGMVFTCEPGIYVREEDIGVRLENDILITEDGPVNLMAEIPIDCDEIEGLMNG